MDTVILYTGYSDSLTSYQIASIIDENGNYHFFVVLDWSNEYMKVFHIFNGQMFELGVNASQPGNELTPKLIKNGVALFFSTFDYSTGYELKYYYWLNNGSSEIKTVSNDYTSYNIKYYIYDNENTFHVLVSKGYGYKQTEVKKIDINLEGEILSSETYILDFYPYNIRNLIYLNGTIFGCNIDTYKNKTTYALQTDIIIFGVTKEDYFNSTVITTPFDWPELCFTKGINTDFLLEVFNQGELYLFNFNVNDTVDFNSGDVLNLNIYWYLDYFVFNFDNKIVTIFYDVEATYVYGSDQYYLEICYTIVEYTRSSSFITKMSFKQGETTTYLSEKSFDFIWLENGSYIFTAFALYQSDSIKEYYFDRDKIMILYVDTDLDTSGLTGYPLFYDLKPLSPFASFWKKNWYFFAIALVLLGIIYAMFFRKINKAIRKLKKFLLRPVKEGISTTHLIFLNIWLFFSNTFKLIFSLWRVNKKRLLISVFGLTVLAFVVINGTTLYDSSQSTQIYKYLDSIDLMHSYDYSIYFYKQSYAAVYSNISLINENFSTYAMDEIIHEIRLKTKIFREIIKDYQLTTTINVGLRNATGTKVSTPYIGFNSSYDFILKKALSEGRTPQNIKEIIISSKMAEHLDLEINSNITLYGISYGTEYFEVDTVNLTIAGMYDPIDRDSLVHLCEENNMSSDPVKELSSTEGLITYHEFYLKNLKSLSKGQLTLSAGIQFIYDFSTLDIKKFNELEKEFENLMDDDPHTFRFDQTAHWYIGGELSSIFSGIDESLLVSRMLIYFLSIPIVFLALFIIGETNALFSSSFEQEINILRSQGLSSGRIAFLYSTMKLGEAFVSTFLGFFGTLIFTPMLVKLDKFISFENPIYLISLRNVPLTMLVSFFLLTLISLPRIIKLSKQEKQIEKPPKKFVQLIKRIRLHYFLIMLFGGFLILGGYWLLQVFYWIFRELEFVSMLLIFVVIMMIGFMFILFGLGLFIRDMHKFVLIIISKMSWSIKKTVASFSLVEIRSDIKLFTNTFFSFMLLVGIILPSITVPLTMQNKFLSDAYFYAGSDLYIPSWTNENTSLLQNITSIKQVQDATNISVISCMYNNFHYQILVIDNLSKYKEVTYSMPKHLEPNWDKKLDALDNNHTILVSSFFQRVMGDLSKMTFYPLNKTQENVTVTIGGDFDYWPIFYDRGPYEYDYYYYDYSWITLAMVMKKEDYLRIKHTLEIPTQDIDRLLIKLKSFAKQEKVEEEIEKELGLTVVSAKVSADQMLFTYYPFYNVLVAQFVFSLLICLISIAFVSLSNPLKMLQQKASKNDILRKLGVRTNKIILLAAFELFVACVIPGLLLGGLIGYGLLKLMAWMFLDLFFIRLPYKVVMPWNIMILTFVGLPALYYLIFALAMKANFFKYRPRNLE
ncbi:MAG: hypothetical protein ACTSQE_05665 [Candidatus Heimdallarchaeaceae archaeon]